MHAKPSRPEVVSPITADTSVRKWKWQYAWKHPFDYWVLLFGLVVCLFSAIVFELGVIWIPVLSTVLPALALLFVRQTAITPRHIRDHKREYYSRAISTREEYLTSEKLLPVTRRSIEQEIVNIRGYIQDIEKEAEKTRVKKIVARTAEPTHPLVTAMEAPSSVKTE